MISLVFRTSSMLAKTILKTKQNKPTNIKQQNKKQKMHQPNPKLKSHGALQKRCIQLACVKPWILSQALPRNEQKDEGEWGSLPFAAFVFFLSHVFLLWQGKSSLPVNFQEYQPILLVSWVSQEERLPAMSGACLSEDGLRLVRLSTSQDHILFRQKAMCRFLKIL